MNKRWSLIVSSVFVVLSALIIIFRLHQLNNVKSKIDVLADQLIPIKKLISYSSSIGYYDNQSYSAVFFDAQFIMAPIVLVRTQRTETLLVIQDRKSMMMKFPDYKVIASNTKGDINVSLLKLNK
jgi:hypothetical protein